MKVISIKVARESVLEVDLLEVRIMSNHKHLSNFDKSQIVMAR